MSFFSDFNRLSYNRQSLRQPRARRLLGEFLEQRSLLSVNPGGGDDTTTGGGTPLSPDFNHIPGSSYSFNSQGGTLSGPTSGSPSTIALAYLSAHSAELGLNGADLSNLHKTDETRSSTSGTTNIWFDQTRSGLDILYTRLNVNVTARGEVLSVGSSFVRGLDANPDPVSPTIDASTAFQAAAKAIGITGTVSPTVVSAGSGVARQTTLSAPSVSHENIVASLVYAPTKTGNVKLAWHMVIRTTDRIHAYEVAIDADNGELVLKRDQVIGDNWASPSASASPSTAPSLSTQPLTGPSAVPGVLGGTYNVYALPATDPNDGPRTLRTDDFDPIASPFGWHDTNGVPGAEFTDTRGNNVNAQINLNLDPAPIATGFRPDGGQNLVFDFPIDFTQTPDTYQSASTTSLFYMVNVLHDIHYEYGFDEAAGNFQQTNYTGAGLGNDAVQADAHAGAGLLPNPALDNAFFSPAPDGQIPQIAMFLWDQTNPFRDGSLENGIITHEFGHGVSIALAGGPSDINALNGQQSGGMGEGWGDWWALMFTQRTTDTKLAAYPLGNYVLGQTATGPGIRRFPYSFDMAIDPHTMSDFNGIDPNTGIPNWEVHNAGELWASVLWDMNWLLVDKYGFDPDLYHGAGGNNIALGLVSEGLKLQPTNPTFLQARDAILLADLQLNFGVNQDAIWEAFSRRGMGKDADAGASANTIFVQDGFEHPSAAYNDVLPAEIGFPSSINVLANDFDSDGIDPTSVTIVSQPAFGTVSVDAAGNVSYLTTNPTAITDTFTYQFRDTLGNLSNAATVQVHIVAPVISIGDLALPEGNQDATTFSFAITIDPPSQRTLSIPYQVNDLTTVKGQDYVAFSPGVVIVPPGAATATIDIFVVGDTVRELNENFTVTLGNVKDAIVADNLGIGTILDDESRIAPVSTADTLVVDEDTVGVVNVLSNDSDTDGSLDPRTVSITALPANGTVTINPQTGAISYRGALNFFGADSLQYTVRDSDGMTSPPATVAITVNPVNDAPVAVDDMMGTEIGVPVLIDVLANDSDVEDSTLGSSVTLVQQPLGGTAVVNPDGTILFTPDADFSGSTIIQYTVRDSEGLQSAPGRVLVRVGSPVEMSGLVFVDANNNGVRDGNEQGIAGVKVIASATIGGVKVQQIAITDASGAYRIQESPGVVLPAGTYELAEVHPSFYVDGKDMLSGVQSTTNDKFTSLVMTAGQVLSGANFGELGVKPEFVAAFGSRRAFFASTNSGGDNLNLTAGDLWYSFDGGFTGELNAAASFSASQGTTMLTLLNSNMAVVATSTASGDYAKLSYQGTPGQSYLLKVSGTNPAAAVRTYFGDTWQNLFNTVDVNNDRAVTALDALVVINALNSRTTTALTKADLSGGSFIDVTGDKQLTALDALTIINQLNARPMNAASGGSLQAAGLIAQALAVDAAMDELATEVVSSSSVEMAATAIRTVTSARLSSSSALAAADFGTGSVASDSADHDSLDELLELIAQ